jgi:arginase
MTSESGEAADMPLGVALGREPQAWAQAAGGPSVASSSVVVLGARDEREAADLAPLVAAELGDLDVLDPRALRAIGPGAAGADTAERLAGECGRFWLHLDVDVLDELVMPATDYLMPGGLTWEELGQLLAPLGASPALTGASLGCLNPEKDPDGRCTARTAALLADALSER